MNTNNTPNGTEGPPATTSNVRGHATADAAAPSSTTVHAPSSSTSTSTSTNTNCNNPPEDVKVKPTAVEYPPANENEGKAGAFASLPQPVLPKPPRPFNVADYDEGGDAKLKSEAKQAMADAPGNLSEVVASLPQPEPYRLEPPRPFNVAKFDEGDDAELKNKAKQVGESKHEDSIIVPTEEDIVDNDGVMLDPATCNERRTRGNEGEAVDLESGGKVEPLQSEYGESEDSLQGEVEPFNSELPVLKAYMVEEESRRDIVTATHVEPILPWWKQRRTKLLLSAMFVVFAVMAVALGVSMSSSSTVVMVVRTDAPSKSLVPTSIPSISLRPSVHPSLPPTTTPSQSPTVTIHPSLPPTMTLSPTFTRLDPLKILADDGAEFDFFGISVAVFEDTLVLVASGGNDNKGSVHIYNRDPETKEWTLQQNLVADDGASDDYFGISIAVFGDTLVVGASGDNDNKGSVHIYNRDPETKEWIFQQKLVADDGAAGDHFGRSVDIYNSTVVVGAPGDDTSKDDRSGSAYIYHQDSETKEWIMQQKLVPDDGAWGDEFGWSVAVFGDTFVVGAWGDDDKGDASGSAYICHQDPTTKEWIFQQKLVPDDGALGNTFGWSVDINSSTVVVGAPGNYGDDTDTGDRSGSAYIYHRDLQTKEWILQRKLVADDGADYDYFGVSVAIHGDTVVVGADGDTDKGDFSGSAYIYNRDATTKGWIFQQKLVADDGAEYDGFGYSAAIYNGTIVVGAPWDDTDKGEDSGSVFVYS